MLGLLLDWVWVRFVYVLVRVIAVIVRINVLVVGLVMGSRLNVLLLRLDVMYSVLKDVCKVDQKNVVNINVSVVTIMIKVKYIIVRLRAYQVVSSCLMSNSWLVIIVSVIVGVRYLYWLMSEIRLMLCSPRFCIML